MAAIKVLYVEDEPSLGQIVKESLEIRDFEVHRVEDGAFALQVYKELQPDICVLDIMLPNKDGYTIAREIRLTHPHIPIIFLTAKTQTTDVLKGFEFGGNDYLKKPFSMEELIVRIHNLLKLSRNFDMQNKAFIKLGTYEFWPQKYELRKGKNSRKLSYREATLLKLLTEKPGSLVIRKDILLKLWGDDSFYNSRNLDVYITKLRDYLKEDKTIQIITLKGIGYQIIRT